MHFYHSHFQFFSDNYHADFKQCFVCLLYLTEQKAVYPQGKFTISLEKKAKAKKKKKGGKALWGKSNILTSLCFI